MCAANCVQCIGTTHCSMWPLSAGNKWANVTTTMKLWKTGRPAGTKLTLHPVGYTATSEITRGHTSYLGSHLSTKYTHFVFSMHALPVLYQLVQKKVIVNSFCHLWRGDINTPCKLTFWQQVQHMSWCTVAAEQPSWTSVAGASSILGENFMNDKAGAGW